MLFISHRGNLDGPDGPIENSPMQIRKAIEAGFEVEVDVWFEDKKLWLGHDQPTYQMPQNYLYDDASYFWFHCKNLEAYEFFSKHHYGDSFNFFWHDTDAYIRTSRGWTWVYPNTRILAPESICVLPEGGDTQWYEAAGVCTDYPQRYQTAYQSIKNQLKMKF